MIGASLVQTMAYGTDQRICNIFRLPCCKLSATFKKRSAFCNGWAVGLRVYRRRLRRRPRDGLSARVNRILMSTPMNTKFRLLTWLSAGVVGLMVAAPAYAGVCCEEGYRLVCKTVYETQRVQAYRVACETVYEQK